MNRSAAAESVKLQGAEADRSHPPEQSPETIEALQSFRVIFRAVRRHFHEVEERCGISGSQLWALASVVEEPGVRVTELARRLSIHQSTASNLVDVLVRRGRIERRRGAIDQRVVELYPTRSGRGVVRKAPQPLQGLLPDALDHLAPETLSALHLQLESLLQVMQLRDASAAQIPLADD